MAVFVSFGDINVIRQMNFIMKNLQNMCTADRRQASACSFVTSRCIIVLFVRN